MTQEPEISELATQETPDSPQEAGTLSLAEAFEQAQQAFSGEEEQPQAKAEDSGEAAEGQPQQQEQPEAEEKGSPSQIEAELDRIYSHIRNGTVDRLPPHLRGRALAIQREIAEAAVRQYEEEQRTVSQLKEKFLELEALRQSDPDAFNSLMWEGPEAAQYRQFYETMKAEFPDLSPENPDAARRIDVEAARRDAVASVFTDMLDALKEATGLPPQEFDAIRSKVSGPWEFLNAAVKRTVELALEKERARLREEEQKAARYEVQREYLTEGVVVPRKLPQHVAQAARSGALTIREALELAQRSMNA